MQRKNTFTLDEAGTPTTEDNKRLRLRKMSTTVNTSRRHTIKPKHNLREDLDEGGEIHEEVQGEIEEEELIDEYSPRAKKVAQAAAGSEQKTCEQTQASVDPFLSFSKEDNSVQKPPNIVVMPEQPPVVKTVNNNNNTFESEVENSLELLNPNIVVRTSSRRGEPSRFEYRINSDRY